MKTNKITLLYALTFLVTTTFYACTNAGESVKLARPEVDIHTAIITNNGVSFQQHIAAATHLNEKEAMNGSTPLITAVVFDREEMVKDLLAAGADLNLQNNDGSTALHNAAFFCRTNLVKLLLEKGANSNAVNNFGQKPYDTVSGDFETVEPIYKSIGVMLEPSGLQLDMEFIRKTRPEIAALLK